MRYTTEELLFAATVRQQAMESRKAQFERERDQKFSDPDLNWSDPAHIEEFNAWSAEWYRTHPIQVSVHKALERIERVADMIKNRRSRA